MIPVGYMAKRVCTRPEWIDAERVEDIHSVSGCISANFADYIDYWKHNGYWLFDSAEVIRELCLEHAIDLSGTRLFFYEVHDDEFDQAQAAWRPFSPEPSFPTRVVPPKSAQLVGYDVVSFYAGTSPECSPLSCNGLARDVQTNRHCLLPSLEIAQQLLVEGRFGNTEPGPYRIFAVHSTDWP